MDRTQCTRLWCFLSWCTLLFASSVTRAGDESIANILTVSAQERPAIAQLKGGTVVVVWQSSSSGIRSIWMRRFTAEGIPLEKNLQVFQAASLDQTDPAVAALDGGGFVIAWSRKLGDAEDYSVAYQTFSATAVPDSTSPNQANTTVAGPQFKPQVASLASGGFVIAWVAQNGLSDQDVFHRTFGPTGSAVDPVEIRSNGIGINPVTSGDQGGVRVARLAEGGFLIVYENRATALVHGVRFDANAKPVTVPGQPAGTDQFVVGTNSVTEFTEPSVTGLSKGGFVIAMTSSSGVSSSRRIVRRIFASNGLGGATTVVGSHSGRWEGSRIVALPNGEFVIAWQAFGELGDSLAWSVWIQRFAADGTPRLAPFRANQFNTGHQRRAALAARSDAGYWSGWQSYGVDKDDYGISIRSYNPDNEIPGHLFIERFGPSSKQQYVVTFLGMGGRTHNLQVTESLKTPGTTTAWSTVLITNPPTGTFSYVETGSNRPPRFFRVLTP